jgi:hypothetical protein
VMGEKGLQEEDNNNNYICCIVLYRQRVSTLSRGHRQAIKVFTKVIRFAPTCRDPVRYRLPSSLHGGEMFGAGYFVVVNWL